MLHILIRGRNLSSNCYTTAFNVAVGSNMCEHNCSINKTNSATYAGDLILRLIKVKSEDSNDRYIWNALDLSATEFINKRAGLTDAFTT